MAKIEINLLPKELRKRREGLPFDRHLLYFAASAGILVALFVAVGLWQSLKLQTLDAKIAQAQRRADQLKSNIELVDALTQLKEKILQRMSAIERLDRNRSVWVRVLEDLSRRVPDYLWLSSLKEEASTTPLHADSGVVTTSAPPPQALKKVTIEGYSYSLNSLASFLIQLMQSQYFKNMELQYVKRADVKKEQKTFSFQLVGELYYLPEVETPGADTAVHELALRNGRGNSDPLDPNPEGDNLAAGR